MSLQSNLDTRLADVLADYAQENWTDCFDELIASGSSAEECTTGWIKQFGVAMKDHARVIWRVRPEIERRGKRYRIYARMMVV